ncbi:MAG: sigma-70 family RNA polymerase sigma factor [Oscillospiraceae bacterium]|nr:sigma-70 family RNA polymerase sigma factor [Oscillospiraceae bacterium]
MVTGQDGVGVRKAEEGRSDGRLVARAVGGDADAFGELVAMHQTRVYNIAYRLVGDCDDARDMAQEAFVKAYSSIGGFRMDSVFSTWLYRITVNVCYDHLRKAKGKVAVSIDEGFGDDGGEPAARQIEDAEPGPEMAYLRKEERRAVQACIAKLGTKYKAAIVLRDIEDLPYEEIGRMLSLPVGTVKSRINRARAELGKIIIRDFPALAEQTRRPGGQKG